MNIKERFLEEVKTGSNVDLIVGPKELLGKVISLDSESVQIIKHDGKKSSVALDAITYYELAEESGTQEPAGPAIQAPVSPRISDKATAARNYILSNAAQKPEFVSEYWAYDLSGLRYSPTIRARCGEIDPSGNLSSLINTILNKLSYCLKINEIQMKFGRIQEILHLIDGCSKQYDDPLVFEMLGIVLINLGITYDEFFKTHTENRIIRLADALVCFNSQKFDLMTYYLKSFFEKEEVSQGNIRNFCFLADWMLKYGYVAELRGIVRNNSENLPEQLKDSIQVLAETVEQRPVPLLKPAGEEKKSPVKVVRTKEILEEARKCIRKQSYGAAYKIVESAFKKDPDNKELSDMLQYLTRVVANARKFTNIPRDNSSFALATRAWYIEEDTQKARKYYEATINNREDKTVSAIFNLTELVMHTEGDTAAEEILKHYYYLIKAYHPEDRVKFFERLASLYQKMKDYEKLLSALNSLRELYNKRPSYRSKLAGTIFRIAQCQFIKERYLPAINSCDDALSAGHVLNACITLKVNCYIRLGQYDVARQLISNYASLDYTLLQLNEKINDAESGLENGLSETDDERQSSVFDLTPFAEVYEKSCTFEGLSEDRKRSGSFDEDDLRKIENEIRFSSKAKPKDRAEYNLTAACIEKELNEQSDKYYSYIATSMLFYGNLQLANSNFDVAKSFYLTAIQFSQKTNLKSSVEKNAVAFYLYSILKTPKSMVSGELLKTENEVLLKLPAITDLDDRYALKDLLNLLSVSQELRNIVEGNQQLSARILALFNRIGIRCSALDNSSWIALDEYIKEANKCIRRLKSDVQLNINFEHDIKNDAFEVKKCLEVSRLDADFIDRYLEIASDIGEYREYSDFDNKIRILNQSVNSLVELEEKAHKNPTRFLENSFVAIIRSTLENVRKLIEKVNEDYMSEIVIDVPMTTLPKGADVAELSVSIANKENRSTARNLKIEVKDLYGELLYSGDVPEGNLKGGSATSVLVPIKAVDKEAFTTKIVITYEDDKDQKHSAEKDISVTASDEEFEKITNPYITGKPVVNDEMFFGRDDMIQNLANSLLDDRNRCIIIYGQKRTGKTSIFDHLKKKLENNFIILSFSVGSDITSENNFYKSVKIELLDYLEDNDFDDDVIDYFQDFEINDFLDFQRFMFKARKDIGGISNKEILLMIDEFTHIYTYIKDDAYAIDKNFMDKWKAMIEKNMFKSALIGQDFMPEFINEYANQFQVTDPVYVSYLRREDAIKLVVNPILMKNGESRYLEKSDEMIVNWFNGQPYYLQTYCSILVNYLNAHQQQNYITNAIAIRAKDQMLQTVRLDFFDNLVNAGEEDYLKVLVAIAKNTEHIDGWVRLARMNLPAGSDAVLQKLNDRGVVEYNKAENKSKISIPFFQEWLAKCY